MKSDVLIANCIAQTESTIRTAQIWEHLPKDTLSWRPTTFAWNTLECVEHLNRYSNFYLPAFQDAIANTKYRPQEDFTPGWLGSYFANSMNPSEKLRKMKTFKDKDPIFENLDGVVIRNFLQDKEKLLHILEASRQVNLQKTKVGISIATWLTIRLGDAFRFYLNHESRHLLQIQNIHKALNQKV